MIFYKMLKNILLFVFVLTFNSVISAAADPNDLITILKAKISKVSDYIVDAKIKTNVAFIKAPVGTVKMYYKNPNKIKIERDKGIFILPKSGIDITVTTLLTISDYDAIDAGEFVIENIKTRKIRVLPRNAEGDLVLMDIYVDEKNLLLMKSTITTRENGSYDILMSYGKYKDYMLPDVMKINFNVKAYKIPKSITMDFDEKLPAKEAEKLKNKKGQVDFYYANYKINSGLTDAFFK